MKFTILLSSAILFATALTPISAYADDNSISCRRSANGCDTRNNGRSEKISINGLDIEVRSFDRGNRNTNRDFSVKVVSGNSVKKGVKDINTRRSNKGKKDAPVVDTPVVDAPVVDNSSNAPVVNQNNNHNHNNWADEPYNPYGGLYGPGT
jgi:phosphopantetheine adenylyltransferase